VLASIALSPTVGSVQDPQEGRHEWVGGRQELQVGAVSESDEGVVGWATFVSIARDNGEPGPAVVLYSLREAPHADDRVVEAERDLHILILTSKEGLRIIR
jgi:hypothetical protein